MRRFTGVLVVIGTLLSSVDATAEISASDKDAIAASLRDVVHFHGLQTDVRISGCQIEITTVFHRSCESSLAVQRSQTKLDLSEVEEIGIIPFRDIFTIRVDLAVTGPSPLRSLVDRLLLGKEDSFRRYSEEFDRTLVDTKLLSGETLWSCDGSVSPREPQASMMLFVDRQPSEWAALQQFVAECRHP